MLSDPKENAVLVDVRPKADFEQDHIDAALNWPLEEIRSIDSIESLPKQMVGKRLLLICQSGVTSAFAARKLHDFPSLVAMNVEGGMQAWVASGAEPCALGLCRLKLASGEVAELPYRESSIFEQGTAVITGLVVKPIYTIISLIIIIILWRKNSPDLAALRWALIAFFVGENFCAANYIVYADRSDLFEYFHSYGMVMCFGLATYALIEGFDQRIIKLSDPESRCVALGLCNRCIKYADAPCGLQRVFLFLIPAAAIVSLAPLSADLASVSYNTKIFGRFYNYSHPVLRQVFELRYLPAAAVILFLVSLIVLRFKRIDGVSWSKVFFAAGIGAIGFSFFRLMLFQVYRDNLVWFGAWEETTELLFVLGVGVILWIFRNSLLPEFAAAVDRVVKVAKE